MGSLKLAGIHKSFGPIDVLKGIDLDVTDGEFVIIVGPSGCGKSTLLRVIAGLEDATAGSVGIDGEEMRHKPPAQRGIAMVFQTYALYPHLDVHDNMALGLRQSKHPKDEIARRIAAATKMLSLESYLERRPAELSGGQRQRVAIGRAIVRKPKLFLFDEPLSNLDSALRVNTRIELARLHRELKATMIYVTHDQTEAMTLGDRVVVMRAGVIQQVGTPQHLYDQPRNLFVAGFIGSPAMNFLRAVLENGVLRSPLGDLPVGDRMRQALEQQNAPRELIIGFRPEAFEDAELAGGREREGTTFTATVEVLESLGSDVYVYFSAEGGPATTAELEELAADSGLRDTGAEAAQQVVARLDAATRAREGHPAELYVDADKAHVFDPATGANLTHPDTVARLGT